MTKFILNLKRYDTEEATEIAKIYIKRDMQTYIDENNQEKREIYIIYKTLYKTLYNENYFISISSNAKFIKFRTIYKEISDIDAIQLLCNAGLYDKVEEYFSKYLKDA